MSLGREESVAIVGMACLFPEAPDVATFWQNICGKVDAIGDPPASREMDPFLEAREETGLYCVRGGYLGERLDFHPIEFGVMPSAVEGAEPDQFLALEIAHRTLLDAGIPDLPLNGDRTEVILGRGTFVNRAMLIQLQHNVALGQLIGVLRELHPEYDEAQLRSIRDRLASGLPPITPETAGGTATSLVTGRIANRFDLKGLNCTIDAACASSLLAVDRGLQDLRQRRCDAALVGGIQVSTPAPIHNMFASMGALSHQTHLRPFDKHADGTMLGEGAGMVLLKRLEDAEREGHRIYAVIRSVGISSDGRAKGVLAPSVEGEALALQRAYEAAGVDPATVGLIEAHGTAMPLGDETEIRALRHVFGDRQGPPDCALGTVKSMISHLIPAAGIAGIIKASLAIYHKTLPPTLHCEEPSPRLEIDKAPFYINNETRPWIHGAAGPRRAGVNAFGFGGINAHALLEEYRGAGEAEAESLLRTWDSEVVVLHGDRRAALIEEGRILAQRLARSPETPLRDLAFTVNADLVSSASRLAIVAKDSRELESKLERALSLLADPDRVQIKDRSGIYYFERPLCDEGKLAVLFPGEGSQYPDMLLDLCLHFPVVRSRFDLMDRAFRGHSRNYAPSDFIFPRHAAGGDVEAAEADARLWQTDGATEAVFVACQALFRLLAQLGVKPDAVAGHSSGEYSALLAAGMLNVGNDEELIDRVLEVNSVHQRLSQTQSLPEVDLVVVGGAVSAAVREVVASGQAGVEVAMENCPNQVVLAIDREATAGVLEQLRAQGGICTKLPFHRPYHTPRFEPAYRLLRDFFPQIVRSPTDVTLWSCATAAPFPEDLDAARKLALDQWILPVRFQDTVEAMYEDGVRIFVEVGPSGNLTSFVSDTLRKRRFLAVAANLPARSGITQLHHLLALLAAHGVPLDLGPLYARRAPARVDLAATEGSEKRPVSVAVSLALPVLRLPGEGDGPPARKEFGGDTSAARPSRPGGDSGRVERLETPANGDDPAPVQEGALSARRRPVAVDASLEEEAASNVQTYLQTMDRFLEVQDEVMQAFLGEAEPGNGRYASSGLSRPWSSPIRPLHDVAAFRCRRVDHLPDTSREAAVQMLSPAELGIWRTLRRPPLARRQWLAARVAAKEAIVELMRERHGLEILPSDIDISSDRLGRPRVESSWAAALDRPPTIAMANAQEVAVAIVADGALEAEMSIEAERMRSLDACFASTLLTAEERTLLERTAGAVDEEWLLRVWCAKESVARILGAGLVGKAKDLVVRELDISTGSVAIEVTGELAQFRSGFTGANVSVLTIQEDDLVAAITISRERKHDQ